ncbi:MAG: tetratricopeptide repeat protein [Acidobacteria bacterium]|nr:tetratricopeptide repeat protein [Acidobacteriota bacterium]
MTKPCPSCGAETHPGARYCRRCGTPVRVSTGGGEDTGDVSPQAATVPLSGDVRSTDGLGADEQHLPSADTARVNQADLDRLLRTQQMSASASHVVDDADGQATLIRADRGALAGEFERFESALGRDGGGEADDAHDTSEIEKTLDAPGVGHDGDEDFGMRTRPAFVQDADEELTVTVPRPAPVHEHDGAGRAAGDAPGGISLEIVDGAEASPPPPAAPARLAPSAAAAPGTQRRRRLWPFVTAACVAALILTVAAAWLAARYLRRDTPPADASAPPAPAPSDARQLFEEKLAEAASLRAAGQLDEAVARLREANTIDPANTRAHRLLGEVLLESGARREALEEFRAVTRNDPNDFTAWRLLASAQFAEGLHHDAAESYRRLIALVGKGSADPTDLLSYADALSRSGRVEEARPVYQRLASASSPEVASAARQRLSELAQQPAPSPSPGQKNGTDTAGVNQEGQDETASTAAPTTSVPAPTPGGPPAPAPMPARPPASSPAEHYKRGVELWSSGNRSAALGEFRAAGNNPEAHFYLGMSLVEGRDLRSLKRAEIVAALQYFQSAQRSGQFAEKARRQAQLLGREFDRLRNQ